MPHDLPQEVRVRLVGSVRRYAEESLEIEMGDLQATLLLDFVMKEIAPTVHNRALVDAQAFLQEKVQDMEDSLYREEFVYWKR